MSLFGVASSGYFDMLSYVIVAMDKKKFEMGCGRNVKSANLPYLCGYWIKKYLVNNIGLFFVIALHIGKVQSFCCKMREILVLQD